MKTYGDIYDEFCNKFPNAEVEDYRPTDPMFIPQLMRGIPNAIIVWLKDGSKVVYIAESEEKLWKHHKSQCLNISMTENPN